MDWPTPRTPIPLSEQGLVNAVYAATCPAPADPMMVWTTQVNVGHLSDALQREGTRSNALLSPAHAILWSVARSLAEHPQLNRRVIGRRIYQLNDVNLVMPVLDRRRDVAELVIIRRAQDMSLPDVATALWEQVREQADRNRMLEQNMQSRRTARIGYWLRLNVLQRFARFGFRLNNRFRLPIFGFNGEVNSASAVVNYFGFPGAPTITSFKPSMLPTNSCHLSVTMGRGEDQPVVEDGQIVIRKMAPLIVRYDHRIGYTHQFAAFIATLQRQLMQVGSDATTHAQPPIAIAHSRAA